MAMYKGETKIKDIYVGTEPIVKVYAGEEFCGFFTLSAYNLVANSDLLIDSNSDNIPDGFSYCNATDISLTNGIAMFTATAQYGSISLADYSMFTANGYYYTYARVKCDSSNSAFIWQRGTKIFHSGSNSFEFLSAVALQDNRSNIAKVSDYRSSGWTPIEVDYIGAINITDLVSRGILPSDLTDAQYKTILDNYFNS